MCIRDRIRPIDRCGCFSFISFAAVSTPPVVALRAKTSAVSYTHLDVYKRQPFFYFMPELKDVFGVGDREKFS